MITRLFLSVFEVSIATGVVAAVLLVLMPLLNKRYAVKWSYYIWIFLAVRLLLPVSGQTMPELARDTTEALSQEQEAPQNPVPANVPRQRVVIGIPPEMTTPITVQREERAAFTLLDITAFVWLAGCVLFLAFPMCSYLIYRKRLLRNTQLMEDGRVHAALLKLSGELRIRRRFSVVEYDGAVSPMILGVFRPMLVLPRLRYSEEEIYFILKHELIHLKRNDVAIKFLLVAAGAVHWFNPLIHLMKRRAVVDMELSCDERVIRGIAYADRKAYTETLFSMIQSACGKRTYLSTQFYGGKQIMKKRFKNIFTRVRKKNGMLVLLCAAVLTVAAGLLVSCGFNESGVSGSSDPVNQLETNEPTEDEPAEDEPAEDEPTTDEPKEDEPTEDEPTADEPVEDEPTAGKPTADEPTTDEPTTDESATNELTMGEPTGDEILYAQMAGTWVIDFDRTENLWGSGISYGDEMAIARDGYGSFSYYIGIGVGGTGQCESDGDALRVEVEPYEDHMEGKEILTLRYVSEDGGEWILMDWYGEDVYWKRALAAPETGAASAL